MRRLVLIHAVVLAAALACTSGALAAVGGEGGATPPEVATSPDPALAPDVAAHAAPDPAGGGAPAESTDPVPDPAGGVSVPPVEDTVPPPPAGEVPTPPLPAAEVPIVDQPPPTLPESSPVVPPPPDAPALPSDSEPSGSPASTFSPGSNLSAGQLTALLTSTLESLRGVRDKSQATRTRGRAGRGHELRPALLNDLLRSGLPFRQVGGSVSGAGGAAGVSFSPDSSARVLGSVLLLALMGAGLIVSTRATVPSSLVALVRLERPG